MCDVALQIYPGQWLHPYKYLALPAKGYSPLLETYGSKKAPLGTEEEHYKWNGFS